MKLQEAIASQPKTADYSFVLPHTAWKSEYSKKLKVDVAVGLRALGEDDIESIRKEAIKYATRMYATEDGGCIDPEIRYEAFNEALIWWIAGRACCDPNDYTKSFFAEEEKTARNGLTPDGLRFIYDEYERYRMSISPTTRLATGDDLTKLAAQLTDGRSIDRLDPSTKVRLLKLATIMLEDLEVEELVQ